MNNSDWLKGKKIIIARAGGQSAETENLFLKAGAELIVLNVSEICRPEEWNNFDDIVKNGVFEYLIFTSVNAVEMFMLRIKELSLDVNFSKLVVIAVGKKTLETCNKYSIPVSLVPKEFSGEGIIKELENSRVKDKVIFIPRSALAADDLPEGLRRLGAIVKTAVVYNVVFPKAESVKNEIEKIKKGRADLVIFTAPSSFYNFLQLNNITAPKEYFAEIVVAVIGKTTKRAVEEKGVLVKIIPKEQTMSGLYEAVNKYFCSISA
jgi:Uroporphyrinogen-III synthase